MNNNPSQKLQPQILINMKSIHFKAGSLFPSEKHMQYKYQLQQNESHSYVSDLSESNPWDTPTMTTQVYSHFIIS